MPMFRRNNSQPAEETKATWEYKTVAVFDSFKPLKPATKVADELINKMQRDGWEYVSQSSGRSAKITIVFRRLN